MNPSPAVDAISDPSPATRRRRWGLIVLLCCVVGGLAVGGSWLYRQQERTIRATHADNLQAIAQLKLSQILGWRQERLADARMNSSGMVKVLTLQWLRTADPGILEEIRQRLRLFRENEGYANMILADPGGRVLLSLASGVTRLEPEEAYLLERALVAAEPVFGDFFFCRNCQRIHLPVAAPVFDVDHRVIAVLLLIADPERDLYPLLKSWPIGKSDVETLVVRKEGDSVLLLNQLRHQSLTPLHSRIPLAATTSPAVRAALGFTGVFQGRDERGEEVLAHLSAIPETGWFITIQMDIRDMLAEARFRGIGILLLVIMATVMAGILAQLNNLARQKALSEALLRAEQEHRRTREEIRATLYGIGDGVISTDAAGLVTRTNPAAEALTGWQEQAALGRPLATVFQVIDEESEDPLDLPVNRVLTEGVYVGASNHALLVARDGHRRPVTESWSPIRNDSGVVTGVVLVFRDQTKRRALEKARAESAKRYSDLVESVNDFIWETGPDHRYTFANKHSVNMLGYTPEEFVGKTWFDILSKEDEPQEKIDKFREILANRQPYNQLCRTFLRKDGSRVVLESSAMPTFDPQGRFLGYRGVTRDITDRKRADEEQKKLQAQLFQAQKMDTVGRLAGGVAHDFNNMLTVICNYVEMTLDEIEEHHHLYQRLSMVHQAALHSAELTRQLLAFARKQVISPRILDLNETVADTLKMLQRLIGEHIELLWKPGPALWPVKMDATQINQILANLAVNARDAIAGTGHLIIETANIVVDQAYCAVQPDLIPGDYVLLTVDDDGCGMDKETLTRIFEPFFTTKEDGRGTGLGLATVYGIVKQNEGMINVYSEPGQGTTFRIYLPRMQAEAAEPVPVCVRPANRATGTILLVEDEPAILELGTCILKRLGYTVLTARTPSVALTLAREHKGPIDLLLTDVIMPEMDGQELARQMQEIRPTMKTLFMSGYTANIIVQHGVLMPGVHFLEKPFSADKLEQKVREVLAQA